MGKVCLAAALLITAIFFTSFARHISAEPIDRFGENLGTERLGNGNNRIKMSLGNLTTGDSTIDGFIVNSCARYNVDPLLIFAQMNQESKFKLNATSYKGASGLMQLMPDTAVRFGAKDIYDPQQNIDAGVKYMRWLLNKFNQDVSLSLAAYNAGEGAVIKFGNQIPPYRETQNYVARITAHYLEIQAPNLSNNPLGGNTAIQEIANAL